MARVQHLDLAPQGTRQSMARPRMENENAPVTAKRALNRAFIQSNLFPWTNLC